MYRYVCPSRIATDPTWNGKDLSPCVLTHVVGRLVPLVVLSISVALVVGTIASRAWSKRQAGRKIRLVDDHVDDVQAHSTGRAAVSLQAIEDRVIHKSVKRSIDDAIARGDKLDVRDTPMERLRHVTGAVGALLCLIACAVRQIVDWGDNTVEWEKLALFVSSCELSRGPFFSLIYVSLCAVLGLLARPTTLLTRSIP